MSHSEDKHPQWACTRGRQCGVCQKGSKWRRMRSKLRRRQAKEQIKEQS